MTCAAVRQAAVPAAGGRRGRHFDHVRHQAAAADALDRVDAWYQESQIRIISLELKFWYHFD